MYQDENSKIRSFAIRGGRISDNRKKLVSENDGNYCFEFDEESVINLEEIFGNRNPVYIEIGFGMGDSPLYFAKKYPDKNLLALEVHLPGIAKLISLLKKDNIKNVRIIRYDAVELLEKGVCDNTIKGIHIFFPDPWPKKRHHKRRLIKSSFINLMVKKLKVGGYICTATDWEEYGLEMFDLFKQFQDLKDDSIGDFSLKPDFRPVTKFEQKGLSKNHRIINLVFTKK